jgi:hypothetical protein
MPELVLPTRNPMAADSVLYAFATLDPWRSAPDRSLNDPPRTTRLPEFIVSVHSATFPP